MSKEAVYEFVGRADSDAEIGFALRGAVGMPAIVRVAAERGFAFTTDELAPVIDLLRFLADARRDAWLRGALARASDDAAIVELARGRGYAFSSEELAHLDVAPASRPLDERDLDRVVGGMGVDTAGSIRTSVGITSSARQTPKTDFGAVLASGVSNSSKALAAPFIPGAAIVSAAIAGGSPSGGAGGSSGAD
jgi:predicted ribosomally synthesized peptide with nif11-like leader